MSNCRFVHLLPLRCLAFLSAAIKIVDFMFPEFLGTANLKHLLTFVIAKYEILKRRFLEL